ncbi:hypothetical protein D9C73_026916 [Xyrichtys novacula]|uniref:G-protein coupled receptors family 1 profile domain-containing protein n=1 Tax=Xyrichtys novacula TaxID=13765 RepID=A0AAV1EHZ9_XYRNO|nr:hypothetical protein D9C73_026916 [Xyrichtys novacula]
MWTNSSSIHNSSLNLSHNDCTIDVAFQSYNTAFSLLKVALIAPLTFIILYLAYQRWKQQGSWTAESHCDVFTYHLAVMELFTILGTAVTLLGNFSRLKIMVQVGMNLVTVPYSGETLFHDLTCVERYLAVVHPLTYRGLKTARGVRIRNVIIGYVWLLSLGWMVAADLFIMEISVNSTLFGYTNNTPDPFSNSSGPSGECGWSSLDIQILTAFYISDIVLLLPLSALVLYLGCKRWRQQRFNPAETTSHSDIFTFHMMTMEMIIVLASFVFCVGLYADLVDMRKYSYQIFSCTWCAKLTFHMLTCVERYVAVVHPVTYIRLKNEGGVRIRNVSIGCVWLLCLLWALVVAFTKAQINMILYFCFVAVSLAVVSFSSVSVLCALKRPGPGDGSGNKKKVDPMKRKASHTTTAITGALFLCFGGMLCCDALEASQLLDRRVGCAVLTSALWFSLPGSLVLPLLFLHRAGTLSCCKCNTRRG